MAIRTNVLLKIPFTFENYVAFQRCVINHPVIGATLYNVPTTCIDEYANNRKRQSNATANAAALTASFVITNSSDEDDDDALGDINPRGDNNEAIITSTQIVIDAFGHIGTSVTTRNIYNLSQVCFDVLRKATDIYMTDESQNQDPRNRGSERFSAVSVAFHKLLNENFYIDDLGKELSTTIENDGEIDDHIIDSVLASDIDNDDDDDDGHTAAPTPTAIDVTPGEAGDWEGSVCGRRMRIKEAYFTTHSIPLQRDCVINGWRLYHQLGTGRLTKETVAQIIIWTGDLYKIIVCLVFDEFYWPTLHSNADVKRLYDAYIKSVTDSSLIFD